MTRTCLLFLAAALVPALLAEGAGELQEFTAAGVWKNIDPKDESVPPPFQQARLSITFTDQKPEGLKAAPEGVEALMYASPAIGGKTIFLAIAKDKADAPGRNVLFFDLNGDGAFGEGERFALNVQTQRGMTQGNLIEGLAVGPAERPLKLAFAFGEGPGRPLVGALFGLWYLEATVKVGEKEHTARFRDDDFDGKISGEKDGWTLAAAGPVTQPVQEFGLCGLSEGIFLDGQIFRPSVGEDLAVKLTAAPATGSDPADLAAHRERVEKVWFVRFDAEKEGFVKQAGVDTKRPLAETPIDWKYVSFAEAQKLAKESGKPLFVDVLAFWCVWCYRMDYYTYPDKEVADLLNGKFIPVKIIQEQAVPGDYDALMKALEAEGIPAMGVWGPDGTHLTTIGGWKKPEEFAKELTGALEKLPK